MPLGGTQPGVTVRRDRRRRRHRQAVAQVGRRDGQLDLQRAGVGSRQTRDRVGLAGTEVVEPLDDAVVEGVPPDVGLRVRLPLERADEVLRRDLDVREWVAVVHTGLERVVHVSRSSEIVGSEAAMSGKICVPPSAVGTPLYDIRSRSKQQRIVLPRDAVVLLLRVERRDDVSELRHLQRAALRDRLRSRRRLRCCPWLRAATLVVTATCGGDDAEYRHDSDHFERPFQRYPPSHGSLFTIPL